MGREYNDTAWTDLGKRQRNALNDREACKDSLEE